VLGVFSISAKRVQLPRDVYRPTRFTDQFSGRVEQSIDCVCVSMSSDDDSPRKLRLIRDIVVHLDHIQVILTLFILPAIHRRSLQLDLDGHSNPAIRTLSIRIQGLTKTGPGLRSSTDMVCVH